MPPSDHDPDDRDAPYLPRDRDVTLDEDGHEITSDDATWAVLAHLGFIVAWFLPAAVILATVGKRSPFVARHAKESLNFIISTLLHQVPMLVVCLLGGLVGYLTYNTLVAALIGYSVVAVPIVIVYMIWEFVVIIRAAIAASKKLDYRYPLTIRLF